jgi:3-hydroxybutyryl-CoA dehydrogenase
MTAEQKAAAMARIKPTTQMADMKGVDIVIEAATENLGLKLKILKDVEAAIGADTIIASNTSSISITQSCRVDRSRRQVHRHALLQPGTADGAGGTDPRPADLSDETMRKSRRWPRHGQDADHGEEQSGLRGEPHPLPDDQRGDLRLLGEGLASAEEIDAGMKLGCNHPIGPLALADMIGLDTMLAVMKVFYEGFNDPKYRPAPLLKEMVAAGYLGRKTGRGFYQY